MHNYQLEMHIVYKMLRLFCWKRFLIFPRIINIKYKQTSHDKEDSIIIDFINPTDSSKFIYSFNEAKTHLRKSSNVKKKTDHN